MDNNLNVIIRCRKILSDEKNKNENSIIRIIKNLNDYTINIRSNNSTNCIFNLFNFIVNPISFNFDKCYSIKTTTDFIYNDFNENLLKILFNGNNCNIFTYLIIILKIWSKFIR